MNYPKPSFERASQRAKPDDTFEGTVGSNRLELPRSAKKATDPGSPVIRTFVELRALAAL
jgi:hypothetical protein